MTPSCPALWGIFPHIRVARYEPPPRVRPRIRKVRETGVRKHPVVKVGDVFGPLTVVALVPTSAKETVTLACAKGHERTSRVEHLRRWTPSCVECLRAARRVR